ncbi:MAG: hypothetical protein ACRED0_10700 [Gammaproteobacteria bacterium]
MPAFNKDIFALAQKNTEFSWRSSPKPWTCYELAKRNDKRPASILGAT